MILLTLLHAKQFPIETTGHPLLFKTAQNYANNLNVHVYYLNRAVKEVTGTLPISPTLGFEYLTYFNNYFKQMTVTNPKSLRALEV